MITINLKNKKTFKVILNHLNILYIEDEKNIRENITKTLNMLCSRVYSVENIQDALLILEENRIDIIISDINLPKISGIEFIKKSEKKIVAIFPLFF